MANEIATSNRFEEMKSTAVALVESGLFGVNTWQQALALGMISEAEGQPFVLAVRDYHVIKNKPVLKSEAMLARFQKAGGRMKMIEHGDDRVVAEFSHPQAGSVTIDWDIERAKRSGLAGKENWKSWPRQMLRARVISEGVRATFPGAASGAITPEEAMDLPDTPSERDVTPAKPLTGVAAIAAKVAEKAAAPAPSEPGESIDLLTGEVTSAKPEMTMTYAEVSDAIQKALVAKDRDAVVQARDLVKYVADEAQRAELDVEARAAYKAIPKAA